MTEEAKRLEKDLKESPSLGLTLHSHAMALEGLEIRIAILEDKAIEQDYYKGFAAGKPTGNKTSPTEPSSNPLHLQPGAILTDKDGREWEVAAKGDSPPENPWQCVIIKPKPKRLTGFVNVYRDSHGGVCYRPDGDNQFGMGEKIARIPLDQFEEGFGLD